MRVTLVDPRAAAVLVACVAMLGATQAHAQARAHVHQFTYTISPTVPLSLVARDASINDAPIRVWVYRDASGDASAVRVTGHAIHEVCAQASQALQTFLTTASPAPGAHLGFGVGEASIGASSQPFQDATATLLRALAPLAASGGQWLRVHELRAAPLSPAATRAPTLPFSSPLNASIRGRVDANTNGPAFIPVRTWDPTSDAIQDLRFTVTRAQLGLTPELLQQLRVSMNRAPIVEAIRQYQRWLRTMQAQRAALAQITSLPTDMYSVTLRRSDGARNLPFRLEHIAAIEAATTTIEQAAAELHRVDEVIPAARAIARSLTEAAAVNRACIAQIQSNGDCRSYRRVDRSFGTGAIQSIVDRQIVTRRRELQRLQDLLSRLSQTASQTHEAEAAVIDALLRGWPMPSDDNDTNRTIEALLRTQLPQVWQQLRAQLQTRRVDIGEPGLVAGVLQRDYVFFRVRPSATAGSFDVVPVYVVSGPYEEIYDRSRHLVRVELPLVQ